MRLLLLLGVFLLGAGSPDGHAAAQPASGPDGPLLGVVWQVPEDTTEAVQDLRLMRRLGIEAVRTTLLRHEDLLTLADTLGVQLFQELPLDGLPAAHLADTLDYARRVLDRALDQARNHPSARHFGLARHADTSDPRACAFFEQLAERVRRLPGGRVYYLGAFIEADRCAEAVDYVLLDARDAADPMDALRRWQAAPASPPRRPAGIGALGTWVEAHAGSGLLDPRSPESQARYLEIHLETLLARRALPAVFVYRWQDVRLSKPSPAYDLTRPYVPGYGLHTSDGVPRPARAVVQGIYTGLQTVFAFPAGTPPARVVPWTTLIGWLVFVLIAACYAFSSRFRFMVPRYFQAHRFYLDAIREGRDVLLGVSVVLLVAVALSVGVVGGVVLEAVRTHAAFQCFFQALPEPVQVVGVALLAEPWMLVLLLSSIYALAVAVWTSMLSFASRRRQPLIPGQALMLVLWVRWPFLVLTAGAMVVPMLPEPLMPPMLLGVVVAWTLVALYAIVRTLIDYAAITYVPTYLIAAVGLLNPVVLLALGALLLAVDLGPVLTFCWHLATRS